MGFNPRLAPYSVTRAIDVVCSSKMPGTAQNMPLFRFPAAGMLIGAYANCTRKYADAATKSAEVEATTNTGVEQVSIWLHATDDTTATYATTLRAAKRTGTQDTSTGGGLNWRWPTTSGGYGLYSLTNCSASRRTFGAGDQAILRIDPYGATDAHRVFQLDVQMDYIIGQESA